MAGKAKQPTTTSKKTRTSWPSKPPRWDLSDLYSDMKSDELIRDQKSALTQAKQFNKLYSGKIAKISGTELAKAIRAYEKMSDILGRIGSYADLLYAANSADSRIARFYQDVQELQVKISAQTLFFTLELAALPEKQVVTLLKTPAVKHYGPWLRDVRVYRPHVLPEAQEKLLNEKNLTSRNAWTRLFDETMESLRFKVGTKSLTLEEALILMTGTDAAKRKEAAQAVGKTLGKNSRLFTHITNTLAKDKEIDDTLRQFPKPISSRNLANHVEDEVVDALILTVRKNYKHLSHRYYKLKSKWFGKKRLAYWDRIAPLPGDDGRLYSWAEAVDMILQAYHEFSPEFAAVGRKFFENDWVDGEMRQGKRSGAFAHPTVPSSHPYLHVNFKGTLDNVMTLAHELGHGIHQVLAAKQGALMADTPLTLAETASVFGEQLVFQSLLAKEKDPEVRKRLIAGKVEDMLGTVVRQIAFCEFERRVHLERRDGELPAERIGKIWMDVAVESLGPSIKLSDEYRHFWSYIPHFIHTPFYVYAYAFGDCLVNSLYAVYRKQANKKGGKEAFAKKYVTMLSAGGTLHHKDLLKPFGLDASEPSFWQQGLDVISDYIDLLEKEI